MTGKLRAEQLFTYQLIQGAKGSFMRVEVLDLDNGDCLKVLNCRGFITSASSRAPANHSGAGEDAEYEQHTNSYHDYDDDDFLRTISH
jgi:hypothetical protein